MVTWKVVLVVIIVAILVMAIGVWFGYQYVSEQEDISPEGWHEPSDSVSPHHIRPLAPVHLSSRSDGIVCKYCSSLYL